MYMTGVLSQTIHSILLLLELISSISIFTIIQAFTHTTKD